MKQTLLRLRLQIDMLSLRERSMIFATAVAVLLLAFYSLFLNPQLQRQKKLSLQISAAHAAMVVSQQDMQQQLAGQSSDPDAGNKTLLKKIGQQSQQLHAELRDLSDVLVKPENMAVLLDDLLKRNGKMRLLSLVSLPVTSLMSSAAPEIKKSLGKEVLALAMPSVPVLAPALDEGGKIYRHGVEIVLQGSYPDMLRYMAELEAMPWQLFWGKATMTVATYPDATWHLTLFTLSLDRQWLSL